MSRYLGPAYKKSRRYGFSTLENGKDIAKRPYAPGIHGSANSRKKSSEYKVQLDEKNKLRYTYGLTEKSFKRLLQKAEKMNGVAGENFLKLLESRVDNLVFRMGMSNTRRGARQIVNHGHILVNGNKVDIPSYECKPGDVISVREKSLEHPAIKNALEAKRAVPAYVDFDSKKLTGTYVRYPERSELSADINEALVVEYYNR